MAIKLKRKKNIVKGNPNIKDRDHVFKRVVKGNPDIKDSRYERSTITGKKRSLTDHASDKVYKDIEKKRMKKKGRLVSKY